MKGIIQSITKIFTPIHREGYIIIAISLVFTVVLGYLWSPLAWIGSIITVWICYFFRDPVRVSPLDDNAVISPADGRISMITKAIPPSELNLPKEAMIRISVFMNVFDCHVNRSPVSGTIKRIHYTPGVFLNAELDKASEDNERNAFIVESKHGDIAFVQIAGLVARRIVSFVEAGDNLETGQRFGLIKFGSRVDVYLPDTAQVKVGVGQRAIAGETLLATLGDISDPMNFRAS